MAAKKTARPPAKAPPTDAQLAASLRATWDLFREREPRGPVGILLPILQSMVALMEEPDAAHAWQDLAVETSEATSLALETGKTGLDNASTLAQVAFNLSRGVLASVSDEPEHATALVRLKEQAGRLPWKRFEANNNTIGGWLHELAVAALDRHAGRRAEGVNVLVAHAARDVANTFAFLQRRGAVDIDGAFKLGSTVSSGPAGEDAYELGLNMNIADPDAIEPRKIVLRALEACGLDRDERDRLLSSTRKNRANRPKAAKPRRA